MSSTLDHELFLSSSMFFSSIVLLQVHLGFISPKNQKSDFGLTVCFACSVSSVCDRSHLDVLLSLLKCVRPSHRVCAVNWIHFGLWSHLTFLLWWWAWAFFVSCFWPWLGSTHFVTRLCCSGSSVQDHRMDYELQNVPRMSDLLAFLHICGPLSSSHCSFGTTLQPFILFSLIVLGSASFPYSVK